MSARRSNKQRRRVLWAVGTGFLLISGVLLWLSFSLVSDELPPVTFEPAVTMTVGRAFSGAVYFNADTEATVSPLLVEAVMQARHSVTLVMFSFELPALGRALQAAQARGVEVTVILDRSNHRRHQWFSETFPTISVMELGNEAPDPGNFMHHKFLLIDEGEPTARLLFGSMNYTVLQEKIDPSFVLDTNDSAVIDAFTAETDRLRQGLRSRQKFTASYRPFSHALTFQNGWVEVWFSPGFRTHSARQRLLTLLQSAERSVDIAVWVMTDQTVADLLRQKAAEGVSVRVIADDAFLWGPESSFPVLALALQRDPQLPITFVSDSYRTVQTLQNGGSINHTSYMHQHFALVDEATVMTGTNNWSGNGFFNNDESIIVTNVPWMVQAFSRWTDRQYRELRSAELRQTWDGDDLLLDPAQVADAATLRVYAEPEEFNQKPVLCFEAPVSQAVLRLTVPGHCRGHRQHAFLQTETGALLAGGYLWRE